MDTNELRKAAQAVYLATDKSVADVLSAKLIDAAQTIERLKDAAGIGSRFMQFWIEQNGCECEDGLHYCGLHERKADLDFINEILATVKDYDQAT